MAIGSLQEGAGSLVTAVMPATTDSQRQQGLRYAIRLLNGFGITAIQDASVDEPDLKAYQAVDASGRTILHVVGSILWEREQGLDQIADIERLSAHTRTASSMPAPSRSCRTA